MEKKWLGVVIAALIFAVASYTLTDAQTGGALHPYVYGSLVANGDLTLVSTFNSTRTTGFIFLGSDQAANYHEDSESFCVGCGAAAGSHHLEAIGNANINETFLKLEDSDNNSMLTLNSDASGNAYLDVYDTGGNADARIYSSGDSYFNGGDVCINVASHSATSCDYPLHVEQVDGEVAEFDRMTSDGVIVYFSQDGTQEGSIDVSGTTVSLAGFTGSHYAQFKENEKPPVGGVVISTGEIIPSDNGDEYYPYAAPTRHRQDKRVYGVYFAERESAAKVFNNGDDDGHLIVSVGLFQVRVTDTMGDISNGDYLCSSSRPYEAEKQWGDVMREYTFAKALQSVEWAGVPVDKELGYKWKLIPALLLN